MNDPCTPRRTGLTRRRLIGGAAGLGLGALVGSRTLAANVATATQSTTYHLTLSTVGPGTVAPLPSGPDYDAGSIPTMKSVPDTGAALIGWTVNGIASGWVAQPGLVMDGDRTVVATFAPLVTFADTTPDREDYEAIVALATRGYIKGLNAQQYGPDQGVQRAQMAALIARATPAGPDTPPSFAGPPAVAGSWDAEVWPNNFVDQNGLNGNLWRDVGVLQHYHVAHGIDGTHFAPTAPVTYAETIAFITRAMVAKGYWLNQPTTSYPYQGVPAVFSGNVATNYFYTKDLGGIFPIPTNWNAPATRGWFALALWHTLDSYWSTTGFLPDHRPGGGHAFGL